MSVTLVDRIRAAIRDEAPSLAIELVQELEARNDLLQREQMNWREAVRLLELPVPLLLSCPSCGERHVDEGEFVTKVHHTHACQRCGMVWRPALVATVGVQYLPGFGPKETP